MGKIKICSFCEKETTKLWFSNPATCTSNECKKKGDAARRAAKGLKPQTFTDKKTYKPTGEYKLFLQIYSERKGICEVTGEQIRFDVSNFSHILSKGAYPKYRLNPFNIAHLKPEIHSLYDNSDKETLLKHFPKAIIIYERKEVLKQRYYQEK